MPGGEQDWVATVRWILGGALVAVLLSWVLACGAAAETQKVEDERGRALQAPANQLVSGTVTYTDSRTVFVAKIERVSKKKTWVGGSVYYPDNSYLKVFTKYRQGELVARGRFYSPGQGTVSVVVGAEWDVKSDRVTMRVDNVIGDPKPLNRRATFDVYTVTKGLMHGPHCGITSSGQVKQCNDDYVSTRLSR